MSYDTVASLQRMQQLEQAQAATGKRLVLKRVTTKLDMWLGVIAFILFLPTIGIALMIYGFYFLIKEALTKNCLVQNVATGEKFIVTKQDFKEYKRNFKKKEKQVRKISDLK